MNSKDEYSLITNWKNGDNRAFDQLFKLHFYRLYRFAFRHSNDSVLAEELVMDMMLKVWQKKDELVNNNQSLAPFLFHALKAALIDNYRKKRMEFVAVDDTMHAIASPLRADDHLHGAELSVLYRKSLVQLSPQRKLILEMRHEQGLSYKEIAKELSISSKTVDRHLTDAIAIVRKHLQKHSDVTLLIIWCLLG
ncbi:RNA polymerase sigma factor [Mucilaginibacter paludis]|uniref:RNA polymerase sigma factor n=1 Tax=Mucilaginibacter paludis TaxID=423351 RepID=UPI00145C66F1|nr:sigma-70 family RNA polymerase sigma factor [Mucilaginibacter paludis]